MSRDVGVGAEVTLKEAVASGPFDAVILPGGAKGSEAFVQVQISQFLYKKIRPLLM